MTKNAYILNWIDEMAAMTQPDNIIWIDGSEEQMEALRAQAVEEKILIKLNQETFEETMLLNMGQILSLPFILWGIYLIVHALRTPAIQPAQPKASRK